MKEDLFILAGEKSGDLLGANLFHSLKKEHPSLRVTGVCGRKMREAGVECFLRSEAFEVIGFVETLLSYPKIRRNFFTVRDYILANTPKVVVFIDYPGFNLRMAKELRNCGYKGKLVQYVSPTVWAWGKGRIEVMAENIDLLLTIYPFESSCFVDSPLPVTYVGNPIRESVAKYSYEKEWKKIFGIDEKKKVVALFPGSRKKELDLNLPYQLAVAEKIKKHSDDVCFVLSCAHDKIIPIMYKHLKKNSLQLNKDVFLLPKAYSYELMKDAYVAIAKSGTVTLELALHRCPSVVMYKVGWINRFIARYVLRLNLPHFCIVNILQKKEVFPELIAKKVSIKSLYAAFQSLFCEEKIRQECVQSCIDLEKQLPETQASANAAQAIGAFLQ